jgi:hypothetical protein
MSDALTAVDASLAADDFHTFFWMALRKLAIPIK